MTGVSGKSSFDGDPKYENLRHLRDVLGYKGSTNQHGLPSDDKGRDIDFRKPSTKSAKGD